MAIHSYETREQSAYLKAAIIAATIANFSLTRAKNQRYSPADFMPKFTVKDQTPEEQLNVLQRLAAKAAFIQKINESNS